MDELDVAARARTRAAWPIERFDLSDSAPDHDDIMSRTTPAERLAMVWPLTLRAWTLAGRSLPTYTRAEMPVRLVRLAETCDSEPPLVEPARP